MADGASGGARHQIVLSDQILLSGLVKSFGPVRAVNGISVSIERGTTVALLGPNGAGKTTTIDLLLGLARPDAGTVSIFGSAPEDAVRAGAVGAMLQTGSLVQHLSVREVITLVASLYPHPLDVEEALKVAGLTELADRRTHKLSGGETQRARLAIALVANPELLVLDEPTVALDVEGRRDFWRAMRAFAASGRTVLFATHYLEEADAYADRIILVARGRIVADGAATEIKSVVRRRVLRATLPDVDATALSALPGVTSVDRRGDAIALQCSDSDAALRRLLSDYPAAHDIEVQGAGLEEAFLELTGAEEVGGP